MNPSFQAAMESKSTKPLYLSVLADLCALPHRGVGTAGERRALEILERHLESLGANTERQSFRTPKTYLTTLNWILGSIVAGLLPVPYWSLGAPLLVLAGAISGWLFFDWRVSPASLMPPQVRGTNLLGRLNSQGAKRRLILMAHFDTAPISAFYRPALVRRFKSSLLTALVLMGLASLLVVLAVFVRSTVLDALRCLLALYFAGQGVIAWVDFLRFGYSNGAADNATGVAAALGVFERLASSPLPSWQIDVLLTSAEEVGMVGARAFYKAHKTELGSDVYVLNFDTLTAGNLRLFTRTGIISTIRYENPLVEAATGIVSSDTRFSTVQSAEWTTGDFDTACFARGGVPSLTIGSLDDCGGMPRIHRPEDTLINVDTSLVEQAVTFADATVRRLAASELPKGMTIADKAGSL
jgi:hypothetical protein